MTTSGPSRVAEASVRKNPFAALFLVLGLLAASIGAYAVSGATTTITPSGPGAIGAEFLVRDAEVDVNVDRGGMAFKKANAAGAYAPMNLGLAAILDLGGCAGDNGPDGANGSGNRSPWTKVTVTGPGGYLQSWYSPAINALALTPPFNPISPQPTGPATNVYRGQTPPQQGGTGFSIPFTLGGAGVYTVTTTTKNMVKTGTFSTCAIGTPNPAVPNGTLPVGSVVGGGGVVQSNGLIVEIHTMEYRPWQQVFTDVSGQGKVSFNIIPAESQQKVGPVTGAIVPGGMSFYTVPGLDAFALPADPTACATDPASCLPANALACDPTLGCEPRLVIISRSSEAEDLHGIFDLESRAFISSSRVGSTGRILFSLGPDLDAIYGSIIPTLRTAAAAAGLDIEGLLGLGVSLSGGAGSGDGTFTLLNGLQVNPSNRKAGLHLIGLNDMGASAGLMLNVYSALVPKPAGAPANWCTAGTKTSTAGDLRTTRTVSSGYTVRKSDLLIDVPHVNALTSALGAGGPIFNIQGQFADAPLVQLNGTLVGADVSTDTFDQGVTEAVEQPLLSAHYLLDAASALATPPLKSMDYIGTATWAASETDTVILGCLVVDFMLGVGVSINNSILPLGWGTLPIWDENPAAASLTSALNLAIADAATQVTTNPTVAGLLDQITTALGLDAILETLPIPGG